MNHLLPVTWIVLALVAGCGKQPGNPITYTDEPFGEHIVEIETTDAAPVEKSMEMTHRTIPNGDVFTKWVEYRWDGHKLRYDIGELSYDGRDCGPLDTGSRIRIERDGTLLIDGQQR